MLSDFVAKILLVTAPWDLHYLTIGSELPQKTSLFYKSWATKWCATILSKILPTLKCVQYAIPGLESREIARIKSLEKFDIF